MLNFYYNILYTFFCSAFLLLHSSSILKYAFIYVHVVIYALAMVAPAPVAAVMKCWKHSVVSAVHTWTLWTWTMNFFRNLFLSLSSFSLSSILVLSLPFSLPLEISCAVEFSVATFFSLILHLPPLSRFFLRAPVRRIECRRQLAGKHIDRTYTVRIECTTYVYRLYTDIFIRYYKDAH